MNDPVLGGHDNGSRIKDGPYTKENSTPADIQAIRDTMSVLEPGIIYWYETPYQTEFSMHHQAQKLAELTENWTRFVLLIDLSRAHRPDAQTRAHLKSVISNDKLFYTVVCTEKNVLLNMAARFVCASMFATDKFVIVSKKEDAIEAARKALD